MSIIYFSSDFFPEGSELATVEMSKIVIKYREAKGCLGEKMRTWIGELC